MLATAIAVATLAIGTSVASARNGISYSNGTTLTFPRMSFEGGLGEPLVCGITIAETLHANVLKSSGVLLGNANVTIATGTCSTGDMGLLVGGNRVTGSRGPYHLTFQSYTGTLPNITSITRRLNDITFWIEIGGITCLTGGAVDFNVTSAGGNPATGGNVTAQSIPVTGGLLCLFVTLEMNGIGSASTSVRLTLF